MNPFEKQYQAHGLKAQRSYPNEEFLRFLGRHYLSKDFSDRRQIKILEVGSGSGANLWVLSKEGFEAYGMDSSPTAIDLCHSYLETKWGAQAKLQVAEFGKLPYSSDYFDAVIDIVSLQHTNLVDKQAAFKEIHRVLKKGGRFFSYHLGKDSSNYQPQHDKQIDACTVENITDSAMPLSNNGLTSFLDPSEAQKLLVQAGFQAISIESVSKTYAKRTLRVQYLVIDCEK